MKHLCKVQYIGILSVWGYNATRDTVLDAPVVITAPQTPVLPA
jgi:hypothetical protein